MHKDRLIVVLGMHRSGTSAITRGLKVMGVGLGERMMPPNEEVNAKGFWEDVDINALNIEILKAIDSDWFCLAPIEASHVDKLRNSGYLLRAVELLRKKINGTQIFAFKDPRVAKLLPFWKEVFNHCQLNVNYVIALRHPLSVVKSLAKRDGFVAEHSYLLWLGHVLESLVGSAGRPRLVVDYDLLMQAPDGELQRIAKEFNLEIDPIELQNYKTDFLDQGLRHSAYASTDLLLDTACPAVVREVYNALLHASSNQFSIDDNALQCQISRWSDEFERIRTSLVLADKLLFQKVIAVKNESELAGQISSLNQTVTERDGQIKSLSQAVAEREDQVSSLNQTVTERDGQISSLIDETVRRGEWAMRLTAELEHERTQFHVLASSNSWFITKPLRETRRWFTAPKQQTKRYLKGALSLTKKLYQSLPLSYKTKATHRNALAKYFPKLLLVSGSHSATIPALALPEVSQAMPMESLNQVEFVKTIDLPTSENPYVSIIIPIYGQIDYTLRCLSSIAENAPQVPFEVIIVDDCSPDNSVKILSEVKGIRLIRNAQNQGFIRSCNAGSSVAKGEYLYFLNNDTEVTTGWLDALLRTFHDFPGTGLAGSKLVYPDGRLQEAGGIIWQDGSAWNFGRFQDPQLPVYNYAREVDYCSGASIMVPKALFNELGGFDEHYLPAYCEDSDLALKIREKGYRVIYQPQSTVVHFEGITSGTDITHGTKAYQVENSRKIYERWQRRLSTHQAPGTDVDNAKDRSATRRVLVLDLCTPTPNQDSGSIDAYNHMLLFREMGFQVTFIPEDNFLYMHDYTSALQSVGIEMLYAPYITNVEQHVREFGHRYDLVFISRPTTFERQIKTIRKYCIKSKVLFHTVDLHFLRMNREADLLKSKKMMLAAEEMKQRELALISQADITTVLSSEELALLKNLLPNERIRLLPYSRYIKGTNNGFNERRDIVFVGGYQHAPNVDAVQYFVDEIMPLLRQRLPGVRFYAVGSKPPAEIQALASEDVVIAGFIEDLTPLLDRKRVSVAPLRYGAGIKGKIGTAMAVGLPVVATSLAAEGMSLTNGENVMVADGPEQFAEALVSLYQDEALWRHISHNGLQFAGKAWGAETAWEILTSILADLCIWPNRSAHPLSLYSEVLDPREWAATVKNGLLPIGSVTTRKDYFQLLETSAQLKENDQIAIKLLAQVDGEEFTVDGFCVPCNKKVSFLVDMKSGGQQHADGWTPNWRERLECPLCHMNNRQRLVATLVKQELSNRQGKSVYFMEQVTPIFNWANKTFKQHQLIGSEYLGHEYSGGTVINGIRHEDVENLSFSDGQIELIVSNDVFEHVPNPTIAFAECARVLSPSGIMLSTIPFHSEKELTAIRAKIINGNVEHLSPPAFHGNPVSSDGSLVFNDFGWDLLRVIKDSGFSDVAVDVYASLEYGHFGHGQLVFRACK